MISAVGFKLRSASKIRITQPLSAISEIRLRAGRPAVCVSIFGEMKVCSEPFSAEEIAECFAEICRYSVHSFQEEIANGFVTLDGGHRVGICGTAVSEGGKIGFIKDVSGLNIRIAHEVIGSAEDLYGRFFSNEPRSLLIAGKPMCGKTTVLRDLARSLGEAYRVTVIDSRNELSASVHGSPSFNVGLHTDVLCGCGKSEGILLALRTMNPQIILCDEIGDDGAALEEALFCGAKLVATAHAGSIRELSRRPQTRGIMPLFDACAVLGERGRVIEVLENGG